MNRLSVLALVLLFAMPVLGRAQQAEVVDGIAAVVNGSVITYSQVREMIGARERAMRDSYQGEDLANRIKEVRLGALKSLIDRELILQDFKTKGLTIPEYLIDEQVKRVIRQDFGDDRAAFVRTLKSQGYTVTRFKQVERDKMIVVAMRQTFVRDDFVISPTRIQSFYEKNKTQYTTAEQVKLRMIVLREDSDTGLAGGKEEMAKEIRTKLVGGAEFGRIAQMYSEDPSTQEAGGDWGWIDRSTLSKDLTERAFALRAGEISDVIPLGNSFYIMMVEARKNAATKPIGEVRDEIESNLIQQEKGQELQRWLDGLRQSAYIKIYS